MFGQHTASIRGNFSCKGNAALEKQKNTPQLQKR